MSDVAQVVAAVSGGALLAVSSMLTVRLHADRRRAEQQRRIDSAVRAVLCSVESTRQERRGRPPTSTSAIPPAPGASDVRSKAHLRLITRPPRSRAQPEAAMRAESSVRASGR